MRRLGAMLFASSCVSVAVWTTAAYAQSALPQFSDPYGGLSAYMHAGGAGLPAQKPDAKSSAKTVKRAPTKSVARKASTDKVVARKHPVETSATTGLTTDGLGEPAAAAARSLVPSAAGATNAKSEDSALGFDLKWSAANGPYYNPSTSTVPAVDEIKRNANETPAETGSAIEAGVNLKF